MKLQRGFTLVEIAIVLVVIGLLLGGVLKGQELLENGRIRKALNDFNTIAAATFTYQDRYRQLPGDDDGAVRFGLTDTTEEGDDDGIIEGNWNSTTANDEARLFWLHLRSDGLVDGSGEDQPANAFNGESGVMFENMETEDEHVICMDNVTKKSAVIIDIRIDDGATTTGSFNGSDTAVVAAASFPGTEVDWTVNDGGVGNVCREL